MREKYYNSESAMRLIVVVIIFISLIMAALTVNMYLDVVDTMDTFELDGEYEHNVSNLFYTNDILKEYVIEYIDTQDEDIYNLYYTEINDTKTILNSYNSLKVLGLTEAEIALVDEAIVQIEVLRQLEDEALTEVKDNNNPEYALSFINGSSYSNAEKLLFKNLTTLDLNVNSRMAVLVNEQESRMINTSRYTIVSVVVITIVIILSSIFLLYNYKKVKDESDHDILTGLYNRNNYKHYIKELIAKAPNKFGACIFCDIDDLKRVNDKYGHNDGDEYIKLLGRGLAKFKRYPSVVVRLAGDEFIAFVHGFDTEEEVINAVNEKIKLISNSEFYTSSNDLVKLKFTSGASIYPTDSDNLDDLLSQADSVLINNKQVAKGEISYYKNSIDTE